MHYPARRGEAPGAAGPKLIVVREYASVRPRKRCMDLGSPGRGRGFLFGVRDEIEHPLVYRPRVPCHCSLADLYRCGELPGLHPTIERRFRDPDALTYEGKALKGERPGTLAVHCVHLKGKVATATNSPYNRIPGQSQSAKVV